MGSKISMRCLEGFISFINVRRFTCVGDVRGSGLVHAIEIVDNKEERIPSPDLASEIMFGMKTRQVLVAITGKGVNEKPYVPIKD